MEKEIKQNIQTNEDLQEKYGSLSFEEALLCLEKIIQTMDQGKIGLAESVKFYQEGSFLTQYCQKKLTEAKESFKQYLPDTEQEIEL